jgi:hypothetical protein
MLILRTCRITEDGGQRTEDRRQKTEDRRRRTEDRGQMTDDRKQRSAISFFCPLSAIRYPLTMRESGTLS